MLIQNARVLTMEGPALERGCIRITDGKIAAVAETLEPQPGEELLDASGWTVMPGMVDAHCHVGLYSYGLGAEAEDGRRATRGIVLGTAVFFSGVLVMTLAMMGNISALQGSQVPMLVLAEQLHPAVATAFAMIVSLGIYTASVPLLWTATARVAGERTRRSRYAVLAAALAGAVMAMTLSFDRLVNIVYVLCGYVGFFLCGAVLWKDLRAGYQRLCARSRAC